MLENVCCCWVALTYSALFQAGGMGSENMTYAERQALGYGTARERLGKARALLLR